MILNACSIHPDLAIFPSQIPPGMPGYGYVPQNHPGIQGQPSNQIRPPPPTGSSLFAHPAPNASGNMNFIRKISPGNPKGKVPEYKNASSGQLNSAAQGHAEDGDSRESTPASPPYPKAGNGLMSKLGPDDADMEWLADDNDFEAFSHSVFDNIGV